MSKIKNCLISYLTNTSCVCQVSFFQLIWTTNKKVFFLKKIRHVTIRDFKSQKNVIFWIVTCVSARDYMVSNKPKLVLRIGLKLSYTAEIFEEGHDFKFTLQVFWRLGQHCKHQKSEKTIWMHRQQMKKCSKIIMPSLTNFLSHCCFTRLNLKKMGPL